MHSTKKYDIIVEIFYGGIAQLGERLNGIQEVSGSIPLISTKKPRSLAVLAILRGFFDESKYDVVKKFVVPNFCSNIRQRTKEGMVEHGKKREKRERFERFLLEEIRTNMLAQWKQTSDNS